MHPEGMGWSWSDLQSTPTYVQRFCWDLMQIKRTAEQERMRSAQKGSNNA